MAAKSFSLGENVTLRTPPLVLVYNVCNILLKMPLNIMPLDMLNVLTPIRDPIASDSPSGENASAVGYHLSSLVDCMSLFVLVFQLVIMPYSSASTTDPDTNN